MNLDYKNLFTSSKLKSKLSSEQFKLSETLLDKRYELNLSLTETSKIVGVHEDEYIKYEYGNTDVPVECYQKSVKRLEEYRRQLR